MTTKEQPALVFVICCRALARIEDALVREITHPGYEAIEFRHAENLCPGTWRKAG